MEDNSEKLDKAIKSLDAFKDLLNKSDLQTRQMSVILDNFSERLSRLEQTIQPVYKETGNLQTVQQNIVSTLERLDYVIKFYTVANEVEANITTGPNDSLDIYIKNLDRLKEAIDYFELNNHDSPELMNVSALYEKGGNCIEREFRQLLARHSVAVPPVLIYDLVHEEDNQDNEESDKTILEQLPEKARDELRQLAQWLCVHKNDDFITVYANLRSEVLLKSLQGLRDHQKSCSGGFNINTINMSHSSPAMSRKNVSQFRESSAVRRTPKSIQQALMKKLQDVIPGDVLGNKSNQTTLEVIKDELSISEREIVGYLTCVTALYKLMQSELKLMNGVISIEHQRPIFSRLVYPSLESVVGEGEQLANRVKKCVVRQDFSSALCLFPILRHQASMRHNFDILFDGCNLEVQSKFQGLVVTLQTTISRSLEEFIDYIKSDVNTKVPKDGTVHQLTSNVMIFIVQLLEYLDILSRVITVTDIHSLENSSDKNRLAFAQYITRILSALGLTLQNKCEFYNDSHLKAIFKLNNTHYILKTLRKSNLLNIVEMYNPEIELVYEEQMLDAKRIYSQSWSRILHYVLEMDKPFSQQRTLPEMNNMANMKLKDKDRQNIKDKFAGFNKEIEEIQRIQTAFAIPDLELRENLKNENKDYIIPKYKLFFDKYVNIDFTKNVDKYIKYTPERVAVIIDSFFDSTA
ncbi:exocyst complex component 7-like [Oppia nitens]|uniref:exocyst complex component 7-like n=1 Tax=Oppia nitens TaxID=1686743 RepID=UPI0023DCA4CD|nr:exocyst complex component 7-like [Oppia nitens]